MISKIKIMYVSFLLIMSRIAVAQNSPTLRNTADSLFAQKATQQNNGQLEKEQLNIPSVNFRKNMGQWDLLSHKTLGNVKYESSNNVSEVRFMEKGVSFAFIREKQMPQASPLNKSVKKENGNEDYETLVWNQHFLNANDNLSVSAYGEKKSHVNYILGNDENKFASNVPDYSIIRYENIYNGIDLQYYYTQEAPITEETLKYDYILTPGSDIGQIKMQLEGIKSISINSWSELEIETEWGVVLEKKPYSYQIINGIKKEVAITYKLLNDSTYGFEISGEYDRSKAIILDPVILKWSTFVGGVIACDCTYQYDTKVDPNGDVYITGVTPSGFPTTAGVYDNSYNGAAAGDPLTRDRDIYVAKLSSDGSTLLYSTYIGGSSYEYPGGIAVSSSGEVFLTGRTNSPNFPVTSGAFDISPPILLTSFFGPRYSQKAFVCKINSAGNALSYSTFLGGNDLGTGAMSITGGASITSDIAGNVYLCGMTSCTNFPVTGGVYQPARNGTSNDGFVTALNSTGTSLIYSTYLGGTGWDSPHDICVNSGGEVYVTGITNSNNFPVTAGAFDLSYNGNQYDLFVTKLNAAGSTLLYSTYIGGNNTEQVFDMALNTLGEVFITGYTCSPDFPVTAGAFDISFNGGDTQTSFGTNIKNPLGSDMFVSKINANGNALAYSTFVGGSGKGGDDVGCGIAINKNGEAYVVGWTGNEDHTEPSNFPITTCAYQKTLSGIQDLVVFKLSQAGNKLLYSTYIGGSHLDYEYCKIALSGDDCKEEAIVGATAHSANFPVTTGAYQVNKKNGTSDQPVVFKFSPVVKAGYLNSQPLSCNVPVNFTDTTNQCGLWDTLKTWHWDFGDGTSSDLHNPSHIFAGPGTYNIKLVISCPKDSITKAITITGSCGITAIATSANFCPGICTTINSSGSGGTGPYTYSWSNNATTQNISPCPATTTTYTVTIKDAGGNTSTSTAVATINPAVTITTSTTNITCNGGGNGSALANAGNGTPGYTYSWSNGGTTTQISNLPAQIYTVQVTDSKGCTATSTTTIVSPSPLIGQFARGTATCAGCGCKEWLMVTATGGTSPYSYFWPDGYTRRYKNQLCPGTYTINIKDKNGCSVNVNIAAP